MGRTKRHRNKLAKQKTNTTNVSEQSYSVNELYKYLKSFGWNNESQLMIKNFGSAGRGLVSKLGIQSNGILIDLPFQSMISLITLENDASFVDTLARTDILNRTDIQYQSLLALYINFKCHQRESNLQPYLQSIPNHFDNPYFCSKQELIALPDNILKAVVAQNETIREQYKIFQENLNQVCCSCCEQSEFSEAFTLDKFKWAYFVVNSRCVFIEPKMMTKFVKKSAIKACLRDEARLALAPLLDFLNHSDLVTNKVDILTGSNLEKITYKVFTNQAFRCGDECFISYGQLTNFKLLIEYGFFMPTNAYDCFAFDLDDIESLIKGEKSLRDRAIHKNKFKFIRDHNLDDSMFVNADELSHNLITVLYLIFREESHFPNILSQVAFGNYVTEDDVKEESELLIRHKIREYEKFICSLETLESLSRSGAVCLGYLKHCVEYLKKYID